MTLTAVFESYEDMMDFARRTVKGNGCRDLAAAPTVQPVVTTVQETPVVPVQTQAVTPSVTPSVQPPAYTAPVRTAPVTPPVTATSIVPTSTASYTLEDLTKAAIPLMDSGKQPALLQLLKDFGVEALPSLVPGQYGSFATALRGLGAQI